MNRHLLLLSLLTAAIGCVSPGGAGGAIFNSYGGPFQATANTAGSKSGESSVSCFLGLVCYGDAGIAAAARSRDIKKVATVDYRYFSILSIVYTRTTIIVTGE